MKTLLHHDGALGDVILSLPVLRSIRRGSEALHFAGRTDIGLLLRECGLADDSSSAGSSRYTSLYAGKAEKDLVTFLRTFDQAFLFTVDPSSAIAAALTEVLPRTRTIMTTPPEPGRMHMADFRMDQVEDAAPLTGGPLLSVPRLHRDYAGAALGRSGHDGSAPVVAIHPGSGSRLKSWPLERFFELAGRLKASAGPFILFLTGPAEDAAMKERIEGFSRWLGGAAHVADADLISAAALLSRCALFIGNDSGAGHLAAAVGCPVLALFGPTDPSLWAPRGLRVNVIRDRTLAEIDADRVYSQALSMLGAAGA